MSSPSEGSVQQFTPDQTDRWRIDFTNADKSWTEPVIGWAVVVRAEHDPDSCQACTRRACLESPGRWHENRIEPVVVDEGCYFLPVLDYLNGLDAGVTWKLVRTEGRQP